MLNIKGLTLILLRNFTKKNFFHVLILFFIGYGLRVFLVGYSGVCVFTDYTNPYSIAYYIDSPFISILIKDLFNNIDFSIPG